MEKKTSTLEKYKRKQRIKKKVIQIFTIIVLLSGSIYLIRTFPQQSRNFLHNGLDCIIDLLTYSNDKMPVVVEEEEEEEEKSDDFDLSLIEKEDKPKEILPSELNKINHAKNTVHIIDIEAESAYIIESAFIIDYDKECSGGKYLHHPEDSGSSWASQTFNGKKIPMGVGKAEYKLNIPKTGKYYMWSRVKWESGCSDGFDLFIDDLEGERVENLFYGGKGTPLKMLGKDTVLDTWHWIRTRYFNLTKGSHTLTLKNHDDGSRIDRMIFVDDKEYNPIVKTESSLQKIHFGCNFYFGPGPVLMDIESGNWKRKGRNLGIEKGGSGILTAGEKWWKNYQMCFMMIPPYKGLCTALFYYKDENNYYGLEISKDNVILYKKIDGVRRNIINETPVKLSSLETEGKEENERITALIKKWEKGKKTKPAPKERSVCDEMKKSRFTINVYNNIIQIFVNGQKITQIKDDDIIEGKAGFMATNAHGLYIDDIEIWSIDKLIKGNENIQWFKQHICREISSTLDSYSSTGGWHPGYKVSSKEEKHLLNYEKSKFSKNAEGKAKVIGGTWLTFSDLISGKCGIGREDGYIRMNYDEDKNRHILWHSDGLLYKDFDFRFKIQGDKKSFGIILKEESGYSWSDNYYELKISLDDNKIYFYSSSNKNTDTKNLDIEWDKDKFNSIIINRVEDNISCYINEKEVYKFKSQNTSHLIRPALFVEGGEFKIDNIQAYLKPDIFYDFQYNLPWSLVLSDWKGNYDEQSFGGWYYNHIILKREDKQDVFLETKRKFKGNFLATWLIELNQMKEVEFSLNYDNGNQSIFKLTKENIIFRSTNEEEQKRYLKDFSKKNRLYNTIRILRKGNNLKVFLNDMEASQEMVLEINNKIDNSSQPFTFKITGTPIIQLRQVKIWGNEVNE